MKKGLSVIVNKTSVRPTVSKKKSISDDIPIASKLNTKNTSVSVISAATTELRLKTNGATVVSQAPSRRSKR